MCRYIQSAIQCHCFVKYTTAEMQRPIHIYDDFIQYLQMQYEARKNDLVDV